MVTVKLYDLALALARVTPCALKGEGHPILENVLVEADSAASTLTLTASDGFRLGKAVLAAQVETSFRKMFPANSFAWINPHKLTFSALDVLLDPAQMADAGPYPKTGAMQPTTEAIVIVLPAKLLALVRSLKRFVDASQDVYWSITSSGHVLEIKQDKINSRWNVPADLYTGRSIWFCVSFGQLASVLAAAQGEAELSLHFRSTKTLIIFSGAGGANTWWLMPQNGHMDYQPLVAYKES